jgi:hypothetical protein
MGKQSKLGGAKGGRDGRKLMGAIKQQVATTGFSKKPNGCHLDHKTYEGAAHPQRQPLMMGDW